MRCRPRPLRETNKFCGHAQSPLGVGACLPYSLSQTGAPSLPPHYQRSSLLRAPPTPNRHRPLPRCSGLSEGAPVLSRRRRLGLLGYCAAAMSNSIRLKDPGWVATTRQGVVDTVACWRLEAIGPFQCGHFGTPSPSRPGISRSIAPRLLSRLRIKRAVTATPARLDTWPVASGYQGGSSTR